jgi:DNA-binding SARP family transcriptional activator
MQILALQGRRAAALRQFEACKSALKRHLDAEPEPETTELAERIRAAPQEGGRAAACSLSALA